MWLLERLPRLRILFRKFMNGLYGTTNLYYITPAMNSFDMTLLQARLTIWAGMGALLLMLH